MAQLLFRVMGPDNQSKFDSIVDALAVKYAYPLTVDDGVGNMIANPESKLDWIRRIKKEEVRNDYLEQKRQDARDSANITDPGLTG